MRLKNAGCFANDQIVESGSHDAFKLDPMFFESCDFHVDARCTRQVQGPFTTTATNDKPLSLLSDESVKRKITEVETSEVPEKRTKTDDVEAVEAAEEATA